MENCEFALEVHSNHEQQKARKMYCKDENAYVMFVDLMSYVKGMLTYCQQKQAQSGQSSFFIFKALLAYEFSFLIPVFPNLFLCVEN